MMEHSSGLPAQILKSKTNHSSNTIDLTTCLKISSQYREMRLLTNHKWQTRGLSSLSKIEQWTFTPAPIHNTKPVNILSQLRSLPSGSPTAYSTIRGIESPSPHSCRVLVPTALHSPTVQINCVGFLLIFGQVQLFREQYTCDKG